MGGALPQPGPATQVAGPMPTPQTQPQPQVTTDPMDHFVENQKNPAAVIGATVDDNAHPAVKAAAATQAADELEHRKNMDEAQRLGEAAHAKAQAGDPTDLSRYVSAQDKEGGSYIKAYLYHRFGLNELAKNEQQKLGADDKWATALDEHGNRALVKYDANGLPRIGFNSTGKKLTDSEMASYATGSFGKGAQTEGSIGYDKAGTPYTRTILPNGQGILFTNAHTGETSKFAPEGYRTTPVSVQERALIGQAAQIEKRMRADNSDATRTNSTIPHTEEDIQAEKARIMGGLNPTYTPATAGTPPTSGEANPPAAPIGNDLSESLKGKIVSANRSTPQQQALYDETVKAGRPGIGPTGLPVAKPGTSAHEMGNAIDLPKDLSRAERMELAQKGYFQPMGADSVHWEKMPTAGGNKPTPTATTTWATPEANAIAARNPTAESIAKYESAPPSATGRNSAGAAALMNDVRKINPDYDDTKYATAKKTREAFTTGKQGDTVRSMNVAVDHLDTLQQAANALHNGNIPLFNQIGNMYAKNTGQTAPTNFDSIKSIVGSEVAKAVSGAGGSALGDREEIRKEINNANSPQQLAGVIKKYQQLMAGQLNGLKTQYEDSGLKDFDKKISPRTKTVISGAKRESENTRSSW